MWAVLLLCRRQLPEKNVDGFYLLTALTKRRSRLKIRRLRERMRPNEEKSTLWRWRESFLMSRKHLSAAESNQLVSHLLCISKLLVEQSLCLSYVWDVRSEIIDNSQVALEVPQSFGSGVGQDGFDFLSRLFKLMCANCETQEINLIFSKHTFVPVDPESILRWMLKTMRRCSRCSCMPDDEMRKSSK